MTFTCSTSNNESTAGADASKHMKPAIYCTASMMKLASSPDRLFSRSKSSWRPVDFRDNSACRIDTVGIYASKIVVSLCMLQLRLLEKYLHCLEA